MFRFLLFPTLLLGRVGGLITPSSKRQDHLKLQIPSHLPPTRGNAVNSPLSSFPTAAVASFGAMIGYNINPTPLDSVTESVWHAMYDNPIVQHPMFEASVASGSFVTWIVLWSSMHLFLGEKETPKRRLDGKKPVEPFLWAKKVSCVLLLLIVRRTFEETYPNPPSLTKNRRIGTCGSTL
jgi:hypothetical protein